ncbi:STAS domain-containing protein [Streptomyces sp. AK04-3B]|uniref:STAS domain-containing protein n=1 Tax=Streptomyces sp. AK04-3B TaxID=3028650 RepID=UPI0029AA47AA|nr:STAS domain-containing protein [Streptomyces sp. AK04-3B]MDX3804062.1 STAS domain-containing protein [Streptomyces sp. AK04-3B]
MPYRTHHGVGGTIIVTLQGEIDVVAAPALAAHLDTLTAGRRPDLVLDLRPVSFIDCAGLGVLCRARNRARSGQGRLRLVTVSTCFLRLLRCTGLAGVFDIRSRWPDDPADPSVAAPPSRRPAESAR